MIDERDYNELWEDYINMMGALRIVHSVLTGRYDDYTQEQLIDMIERELGMSSKASGQLELPINE